MFASDLSILLVLIAVYYLTSEQSKGNALPSFPLSCPSLFLLFLAHFRLLSSPFTSLHLSFPLIPYGMYVPKIQLVVWGAL